jgi:hypothetical protein
MLAFPFPFPQPADAHADTRRNEYMKTYIRRFAATQRQICIPLT